MCCTACSLIVGGFIGVVAVLVLRAIVTARLKRKLNEIEGWMA